MSDPQEQMRKAMRELSQELSRSAETASRMIREALDEAQRYMGQRGWRAPSEPPRRPPRPPRPEPSDAPARPPLELIRELASLRDDGLISEEEFQAKKRELLERL